MLTSLPYRKTEDGKVRTDAYLIALEGVTRFGLGEATKAILRGSLGHGFYPSPVELRQQCDRAMDPVWRQGLAYKRKQERQAFNDAERKVMAQQTPEARERVRSTYEQYCARHEAQREPRPETDWDKINARFDAERRKYLAIRPSEREQQE